MNSERLYQDLIRDEGKRLTSYQDTKGLWTIGVGHLLGKERRMITITEAECRALYDADVSVAEAVARRVFDVGKGLYANEWVLLDDVRKRALVNMAFNRGEQHMQESTTITPAIRAALQAPFIDFPGCWKRVAEAIKASPWAAQIGGRATRLAYMLETGKDPQ